MISNGLCVEIAELDLDPIKVKLMHQESGEGWSLETVTAIEGEYRRFLHLMKTFPNEQTAPRFDVDIFWHYHILDTMKYAEDCQHVFGYFLHHFPYIGLRGEDDEAAHHRIGERMRVLYEETFGESYDRVPSAQAGTAFSAANAAIESAATAATAFSAAKPLTAFSAAKPLGDLSAAKPHTAFSAATAAGTAFSAAAPLVAFSAAKPRTAFSAATAAGTAFSAAAPAVAFSAASPRTVDRGAASVSSTTKPNTAFSASAPSAFSAALARSPLPPVQGGRAAADSDQAAAANQHRFYSERPTLAVA